VEATSREGRARLHAFQGDAPSLVHGRARRIGSHVDDAGLIFTEYAIKDSAGGEMPLRVLGGVVGGIGQRAIHGEVPPAEQQEIVVATQADGVQHWAFATDGKLFGGHLGDGPAIAGRL
jgi:hypothetical protein